MEHKVPFVAKENVTIVSIGSALESTAIRSLLECFNYRVTIHWVGSKKEVMKIISGEVETDGIIILSCHGVEAGIVIPSEPPLGPSEIEGLAVLSNKLVISTGCLTGAPSFSDAFRKSGVSTYIAPVDYPSGKATLMFVSTLFYLLSANVSIREAIKTAASFDTETMQFKQLV